MHRKIIFGLMLIGLWLLMTACGRRSNVCATDPPNLPIEERQQLNQTSGGELSFPVEINIRQRTEKVDKIVHGYLCDDQWRGTVYVDCDVSVPDWELSENGEAKFFTGCDLEIEEGTVVYVAYHNDEAYYKGCSCHSND